MRIFIGINTLSSLTQPIYANHCEWFFKIGKHYGNDHQFCLYTPRRASIDRMRNESARLALENQFDYLIFIDDDILVPLDIDAMGRWIELFKQRPEAHIIASHTIIRGYPYNNMAFKRSISDAGKVTLDFYNDYKDEIEPDGLVKCDAVGCSLIAIRCEMFKQIPPPFFVTGPHNTEDIYFCCKAADHIENLGIYFDTQVKTGHLLAPNAVSADNREMLKEFDEKEDPGLLEIKPDDRGLKYVEAIKRIFDKGGSAAIVEDQVKKGF